MRIRTAKQAAKLRPIATERARQSKIREGDVVFHGGIGWGEVRVDRIYRNAHGGKLHSALVFGKRSCWVQNLAVLYPTKAEYIASGVHWDNAAWQGRKIR